jgi:hypothetical protein
MESLGSLERQVAELIAELDGRRSADALCRLAELGAAAITWLAAGFAREADPVRRAAIVHALWQTRDPVVISTLAVAVCDRDARVWKEALNGLVTLDGSASIEALRSARNSVARFEDARTRREWIDEAIVQADR